MMSGGCASHSWQTEAPGDFGPGLFLCCDAAHQQLRAAFHKGPQVAGLFVAEERGSHELKGAPKPVTLFRLVRASGGGRHVSNGSLQEGDSTLFALIGQHLHERDPRGIVDANMNELLLCCDFSSLECQQFLKRTIGRKRLSPEVSTPSRCHDVARSQLRHRRNEEVAR
jgi:hypothetical protein